MPKQLKKKKLSFHCSSSGGGHEHCDKKHRKYFPCDCKCHNPAPDRELKTEREGEVEKLDLITETTRRENEIRNGLRGYAVISQSDRVIEDKINELISAVNILTKGKKGKEL